MKERALTWYQYFQAVAAAETAEPLQCKDLWQSWSHPVAENAVVTVYRRHPV